MNKIISNKYRRLRLYDTTANNRFDIQFYQLLPSVAFEYINLKLTTNL